jgi:hypothetical protein
MIEKRLDDVPWSIDPTYKLGVVAVNVLDDETDIKRRAIDNLQQCKNELNVAADNPPRGAARARAQTHSDENDNFARLCTRVL